ncbi:unnamed protein product [Effrenium voratum]|nr:unnamed protein product [Effrenium voratum]
MASHSYYDYAGGGVVHLAGGMAALAGNLLVGRRILRPPAKDFIQAANTAASDEKERLKEVLQETWQRRFDRAEDDEKEFRPNGYLQVMGTFTLWVGCYGFNASPAFARGDSASAALAAWNTTLAASAGSMGAFLHSHFFKESMELGFLCNGILSGLVALTVACDILKPWGAVLVGFIAGFVVYPLGHYAMRRLRVDDPADAIPVHAGSALFGVLSAGLCKPACGPFPDHPFCRPDHQIGLQFLAQLVGVLTIIGWTLAVIFPVWAFFLFSESIRSLELENLVQTFSHTVDMEAGNEEAFWKEAARSSRVLRSLLSHYGWTSGAFAFPGETALRKDETTAAEFRADLLDAIQGAKSALETDFCLMQLFIRLARQAKRLRCCQWLGRLRLRISPFAELSGLGALAPDVLQGQQMAEMMKGVLQVVTDMRTAESQQSLPLQQQLDNLTRQVQNQGVLLQRMSRSKRFAGFRAHLASVSETERPAVLRPEPSPQPPEASPAPVARGRERLREHGNLAELHARAATPEDRPRTSSRSVRSTRSMTSQDSTISDKSMGLITPRSGDETPPPTLYGRLSSPRGGHAAVSAMASELANLLQAQQRLVSSLQPSGNEEFHRQLLVALDRRERPQTSRSRSSLSSSESFPLAVSTASLGEGPSNL